MKQEQVSAFCRRQQEEGRIAEALWMPAPDLRELAADAIGDGTGITLPDGTPMKSFAGGLLVAEFLNPATGAVMPLGLMPEGGEPMASVRTGEDGRTFLVPVG